MTGREENEGRQTKPKLLTLCVLKAEHNPDWLLRGNQTTSVKKHSTPTFLSMADKLKSITSPLNSIVEEQAKEMKGLGIRLPHLKPGSEDCLKDISNEHFQMIFASAEDCLSKKFTEIQKEQNPTQNIPSLWLSLTNATRLRHLF